VHDGRVSQVLQGLPGLSERFDLIEGRIHPASAAIQRAADHADAGRLGKARKALERAERMSHEFHSPNAATFLGLMLQKHGDIAGSAAALRTCRES